MTPTRDNKISHTWENNLPRVKGKSKVGNKINRV